MREFLQANARLDSVIEQVASSRTEIIRVSAYASIAMHWLPGIIQRFREECPDVDVDIRMADHVDIPYELLRRMRASTSGCILPTIPCSPFCRRISTRRA